MNKISFFYLYEAGLSKKNWKCTTLFKEMKKKKKAFVTVRTLQRYRSREVLPNFNTAKAIYETLGIEATDEEVMQSLQEVQKRDLAYENSKYIDRNVRLRISRLSRKIVGNASIQMELNNRIRETQNGDRPNFNKYVSDLIQKDIDEHILPNIRKEVKHGRKK